MAGDALIQVSPPDDALEAVGPALGPQGPVTFSRRGDLPGVEVMSAADSRRLWTVMYQGHCVGVCDPRRVDFRSTVLTQGATEHYACDTIQLGNPGEVFRVTDTRPTAFHAFTLDGPWVARHFFDLEGSRGAFSLQAVKVASPGLAVQLWDLGALFASPLTDPLQLECALMSCLGVLLRTASDLRFAPRPGVCCRAIKRAREFIHEHHARRFSLTELAAAAGISRFHLARLFKGTLGMSAYEYLRLVRLDRAMRLLRAGLQPKDVARVTGFTDQTHLTRLMARSLGVTPAAYARAVGRA
jgi:AraC-like DNA-binding protein